MTSSKVLFTSLLFALAAGCGSSSGPSPSPTSPFHLAAPAANVMAIDVNGSLCLSSAYVNEPCVGVTVCSPGGTVNCQTINGILLDTGSSGLRIFQQVLTVQLQQVASGAGSLAECIQYGDGSSDWGPIEMADVILAGEPAVEVPVQVIDSSYSSVPSACSGSDQDPADAGFNGILGLGIFAQDCGTQCASVLDNGWYYSCQATGSGAGCTQVTAALATQVPNPAVFLPQDNNGVVVQLPSIPADGALSLTGALVLGIGTQSNNNAPAGVAMYSVDQYGEFATQLSGQSYSAFLDTGSDGIFFSPSSSSQLPTCPCPSGTPASQCIDYTQWFCPSSTVDLSATNTGATGSPSSSVAFQIVNFEGLDNSPNNVFPNIAGPFSSNEFDWGLPFYFGRDVYFGFEGTTSSLGTGPYFAY
jgi:hypothetical protein